MNDTHPTAEQLERYRRRAAPPAETLTVDAHIATCDACHARVFAAERHLDYEDLVAVVDGRASAADREAVERHATACSACAGELADLRRMRDAMEAAAPRRRWQRTTMRFAAAAAIAAIVFAGAWLWTQRNAQPPSSPAPRPVARKSAEPPGAAPPPQIALQRPAILDTLIVEQGVLRGAADPESIDLHEPVGTVVLDDRPRFRWSAAPGARSYAVAVADASTGTVAASGSTPETSWQPAAPLPRGRTYMWQVTVRTDVRTFVSPGPAAPPALFQVATDNGAAAAQASALDRGIALANRGALDDAERALESAVSAGEPHAAAVLTQVRAWRPRQRALPTATNGAQ